MAHLYQNKDQEKLFHLHYPVRSTNEDCNPVRQIFTSFKCEDSFILAQPTTEFNCIGWAIGVKEFIDPTKHINHYYQEREDIGFISVQYKGKDAVANLSLYNYQTSSSSCIKAVESFFDEYKSKSVLPDLDSYVAVEHVPDEPKDGTIAFYFKDGEDVLEERSVQSMGFQHASRYVAEVNSWVSDVWTSKLGQYKLMTHDEHELDGDVYGHILCYLVAQDSVGSVITDEL